MRNYAWLKRETEKQALINLKSELKKDGIVSLETFTQLSVKDRKAFMASRKGGK